MGAVGSSAIAIVPAVAAVLTLDSARTSFTRVESNGNEDGDANQVLHPSSSSGVQVAAGDVSEVVIEETPSHLHHALSPIQSPSQSSLRSSSPPPPPPPPPLSKPIPMTEPDEKCVDVLSPGVVSECGPVDDAVPQMPQVSLTFLLVSGRRRAMSFDPETTIGRVKELVWNTWPTGT
jgi:hypothetical protein